MLSKVLSLYLCDSFHRTNVCVRSKENVLQLGFLLVNALHRQTLIATSSSAIHHFHGHIKGITAIFHGNSGGRCCRLGLGGFGLLGQSCVCFSLHVVKESLGREIISLIFIMQWICMDTREHF